MLPQISPPVGGVRQQPRKPFVAPMPMTPPQPGFSTAAGAGKYPPGTTDKLPSGGIGMPPSPMRGMAGPNMQTPGPVTPGFSGSANAPMPTMPQAMNSMATATPMAAQMGANPAPQSPAPIAPNRGNTRYGTDNAPSGTRPPVGNTNPAWNPQSGVSPFNASSGATGIGDFQRFSDNAYNESVRRLDPQFAEQQRGFEQDMVNRGIAPGTEAYDNARANFDQSRNDAYASARANADQQGLAAQQQSFGQGATNSGLLNQLLLGQMGADASRYGSNQSAHASMYGSDRNAESNANNLAYQMQQGDFGNLMQLLNFGQGTQGFNNGVIGQNNGANSQYMGQNAGLLGLFQGGGNPSNIDVTGPYNNQYNAGLNTAQFNQNQQNANNQAYAQWASALLCDRDAKDEIAVVDPQDALKAIESIPLVCWSYKAGADRVPHVGTYAQDFNAALGLPEATMIQTIDLFGALIGSVQALTARIKELEAA